MYVYIDGEYQCNRFRQNLRMPDGTTTQRQTEVDFRVRQKEEMLEDGTFEGKQWRFENLNIGEHNPSSSNLSLGLGNEEGLTAGSEMNDCVDT